MQKFLNKLSYSELFCHFLKETSQELRMLSSLTINCQVRMIVWIQVLNCQNCNHCLKCQVYSTVFEIVKNEGEKYRYSFYVYRLNGEGK